MTTGKTIALARRTFVVKVMSLHFNMLSRFIITFLPRSKNLLISWLQSPSAYSSYQPSKVGHKKNHLPIPSYLSLINRTRTVHLWRLNFFSYVRMGHELN